MLFQFDKIATAPLHLLYKTLSTMSAHFNVSQLLVQVAQLTWDGGRHKVGCWTEEQQQVREDPWNPRDRHFPLNSSCLSLIIESWLRGKHGVEIVETYLSPRTQKNIRNKTTQVIIKISLSCRVALFFSKRSHAFVNEAFWGACFLILPHIFDNTFIPFNHWKVYDLLLFLLIFSGFIVFLLNHDIA